MPYDGEKYVRMSVDLTRDEYRRLVERTDGIMFRAAYIRDAIRERLDADARREQGRGPQRLPRELRSVK